VLFNQVARYLAKVLTSNFDFVCIYTVYVVKESHWKWHGMDNCL